MYLGQFETISVSLFCLFVVLAIQFVPFISVNE